MAKDKKVKADELVVRMSPYVMAKIRYISSKADGNEFSGFGISKSPEDVLSIVDFVTVKQKVSRVTVELDDDDVARYFDEMIVAGKEPLECMRIWIHTHPGMKSTPSGVDRRTFEEIFGKGDWAIMMVIGEGDDITTELSYKLFGEHRVTIELDTVVDWEMEFEGSRHKEWAEEVARNIEVQKAQAIVPAQSQRWWDDSTGKRDYLPSLGGEGAQGTQCSTGDMWDEYSRLKYPWFREEGDELGDESYLDISWEEFRSLRKLGWTAEEIRTWGTALFGCTRKDIEEVERELKGDSSMASYTSGRGSKTRRGNRKKKRSKKEKKGAVK